MVIVDLIGGLGNQMFQYAAARALSLAKGQPLYIDASAFEAYQLHRFELTRVFDCPAELASETQLRQVLGWRASRKIRRWLLRPRLNRLRGRHFVVEPHFHFWPGLSDVPDDCYLSGYWQSEKYFSAASDHIRKDFTFRTHLDGRNFELAQQMADCEAVSLHIRRGDYVSDKKTNTIYGTCSLDYYRNAVAHIAGHGISPHFFVFSDDIAWAKENLKLDFPSVYIDHNRGDDNYRDMQLMSLCRHHIIANSSFSWWGAWLNPRSDKIVVAPKQWFATDYQVDDLLPSAWTLL